MRIIAVHQICLFLSLFLLITLGAFSYWASRGDLYRGYSQAIRSAYGTTPKPVSATTTPAPPVSFVFGPMGVEPAPPMVTPVPNDDKAEKLTRQQLRQLIFTIRSYALPAEDFTRSGHCPALAFLNENPRRAFDRPYGNTGDEFLHLCLAACNLHELVRGAAPELPMCYIPAMAPGTVHTPPATTFKGFCDRLSRDPSHKSFAMENSGIIPLSKTHVRYIEETAELVERYVREMKRLRRPIGAVLNDVEELIHFAGVRVLEATALTLRRAAANGKKYSAVGRWFMLDVVEYLRGVVPLSMQWLLAELTRELEGTPKEEISGKVSGWIW